MSEKKQVYDKLRVDVISLRKPYKDIKGLIKDLEEIANDQFLNLDEIKTIEIHYNKETLNKFIKDLKGI